MYRLFFAKRESRRDENNKSKGTFFSVRTKSVNLWRETNMMNEFETNKKVALGARTDVNRKFRSLVARMYSLTNWHLRSIDYALCMRKNSNYTASNWGTIKNCNVCLNWQLIIHWWKKNLEKSFTGRQIRIKVMSFLIWELFQNPPSRIVQNL